MNSFACQKALPRRDTEDTEFTSGRPEILACPLRLCVKPSGFVTLVVYSEIEAGTEEVDLMLANLIAQ
jgi:hypothetical protein